MVLLEEVKLLLQAVQVSSESGDDLIMIRLRSPKSLAVSLHRLAQGGLGLPSSGRKQTTLTIPVTLNNITDFSGIANVGSFLEIKILYMHIIFVFSILHGHTGV